MDQNENLFDAIIRKFHVNKNLIMLKMTLFVMYGATSSLVPFLTVHMQSVGLTVEEIAIIYLALPLTTFLAPPVTGFLVDKFGHYKPVLFISLIMNAVFHHSLMLIPQMETPGKIPPAYVMRHPLNGKVEVWWSPCPSRECPEREELNLVVDKCEDYCILNQPNDTSAKNRKNWLTKVEQSIAVGPPTLVLNNPPLGCALPSESSDTVIQPSSSTPNPDLHFIVEKRLKNNTVKSTSKSPPLSRKSRSVRTSDSRKKKNKTDGETVLLVLDMHENLMTPVENLGMELPEHDDSSEVTDFRQHFNAEVLFSGGVNFTALLDEDLRCGGRVVATNLTYRKLNELAADCMLQKCTFRSGGPEICPPDYLESDDRVFWLYFGLRFVGTTMISASVTVMDPIALTLIQKHGGEYGRERLFSTIGMAIFSPLTGILIDYKTKEQGHTDFSYAFYMYDILLAISVVTVLWMPVGAKMPVDNIMIDMLKLLKLPHIIAFIFFMFALGNLWGFIESYLFLHLKELGASNYLLGKSPLLPTCEWHTLVGPATNILKHAWFYVDDCGSLLGNAFAGITVSVATVSSIPFLYGAERITHKIGHVNVIVLAFFSHAVRLVGYSYIEDPWWVFPFEAMEAIAVHLMWVSAATYCAVIAPKNLLATLIGVLGMAHFSLGRGSGSFIGGFLISQFGTRQSFRYMGIAGFTMGSIYSLLYCMWLNSYDRQLRKVEAVVSEILSNDKLNNAEDLTKSSDKLKESEDLAERLSLIIKLNHRGSLTSLDKVQTSRRNSSNIELGSRQSNSQIRIVTIDGSSSTLDLLKSNLDLTHMYKLSQSSFIYCKTPVPHLHKVSNKDISDSNIDNLHFKKSSSVLPTGEMRARSGSIPEEEESVNLSRKSVSIASSCENLQKLPDKDEET